MQDNRWIARRRRKSIRSRFDRIIEIVLILFWLAVIVWLWWWVVNYE